MNNDLARTSFTDPFQIYWIQENIGEGKGKIGLSMAPGRNEEAKYGEAWTRDLSLDLDRIKEHFHVHTLVSLVSDLELEQLKSTSLVLEANKRKIAVIRSPLKNYSIPSLEQASDLCNIAVTLASGGQNIVFHCWGGHGRSGTLVACCLLHLGFTPQNAIDITRKHRPGAIEGAGREEFIHQYFSFIDTP